VLAALIRAVDGAWDAADDALAEALARAVERWAPEGVPERPAAWMLVVARRILIGRSRRHSTRSAD
jgi:RNA polymerase sigma-70 factor (ECF subfamily)